MKTDATRVLQPLWQAISEVPGWQDAPRSARLRRVLPILIPCVVALGVFGWMKFVGETHMREIRAANAPLVARENELATLRLSCSDQGAANAAARAAEAARALFASTDDATHYLQSFSEQAKTLGLESSLQAYDSSADSASSDPAMSFAPARLRLVPIVTNDLPFNSVLAAIDQLSKSPKRIDLTRLSMRVDDSGRLVTELFVRSGCAVSHEKAAE